MVDVHTDPLSGNVLEVGTGSVEFLVAAIDNEGDTRVYVGPVSSYYEFTWPAAKRLTDDAWGQMLRTDRVPDRPQWMDPILHPPKERTTR